MFLQFYPVLYYRIFVLCYCRSKPEGGFSRLLSLNGFPVPVGVYAFHPKHGHDLSEKRSLGNHLFNAFSCTVAT